MVGKALSHRLYWNNGPHEVEGPLIPIKPIKPITKGFIVWKRHGQFFMFYFHFSVIPGRYLQDIVPKKIQRRRAILKKLMPIRVCIAFFKSLEALCLLKCLNFMKNNNFGYAGTGLYGVLCKKFHMLFSQDHFGHIIIPAPLQRQFKNIYLIFKLNDIITFFINFYDYYLPPFLITISIL